MSGLPRLSSPRPTARLPAMEMGEMEGRGGWRRGRNKHRHRDKPGESRARKKRKELVKLVGWGTEGRAG